MADQLRFVLPDNAGPTSCLRVEIYGRPLDNSTGIFQAMITISEKLAFYDLYLVLRLTKCLNQPRKMFVC